MSFFKKLLGGTFEDHFNEGKRLYETESFGSAKLSLERALARSKGADLKDIEAAQKMVSDCRQSLARGRIEEADKAAASGDIEDAARLLQDAKEICEDDFVLNAVRERLKAYEASESRHLVEEVDHIDDDELLTIIAGTWSEDQADEYAAMPEEFRSALLLDHDGRHKEAAEILIQIAARTDLDVPLRYVYFEIGKALLSCERFLEAVEMLDSFFTAVGDDDNALETRLSAHDMKAAALSAVERFDEAEQELRQAAATAPGNHAVFLKLGVYLRRQKKFDASVKALERSRQLMGQLHPDFSVIRELGFTYLAMDRKEEAIGCFGAVIEHLASRGEHTQFDPQAAVALASLYEDRKDFQKAADLYRHLAVGYDTVNYFTYNYQAARLLMLAEEDQILIERYLTRARQTAETDEQTAMLDKLEIK